MNNIIRLRSSYTLSFVEDYQRRKYFGEGYINNVIVPTIIREGISEEIIREFKDKIHVESDQENNQVTYVIQLEVVNPDGKVLFLSKDDKKDEILTLKKEISALVGIIERNNEKLGENSPFTPN